MLREEAEFELKHSLTIICYKNILFGVIWEKGMDGKIMLEMAEFLDLIYNKYRFSEKKRTLCYL